jgi:hypothetical protein
MDAAGAAITDAIRNQAILPRGRRAGHSPGMVQ